MAATQSRDTIMRNVNPKVSIPLKANAKVYKGTMIAIDASGYAVSAAAATAYQVVLVASADADNTGGLNGAISVDCYECEAYFANSSTAACDATCLGNLIYVEDNQTLAKTSETSSLSVAGRCTGFDSGGVWVRLGFGMIAS